MASWSDPEPLCQQGEADPLTRASTGQGRERQASIDLRAWRSQSA
jgi:hypothetical protein